ncbi:MAG: regulatory protein RecX [Desulfosarcinaceae bacterium]|nr:regulatory protein RecX [Desulfosarcinaceae bacterium]
MKEEVLGKSEADTAHHTAIRILARRPHSGRELSRKLRQRGFSEETVAKVLAYCEANRFIDDAATSETYCRELIRKGFGPRAVRQRLSAHGFDTGLIQDTLAKVYTEEVIRNTAHKVGSRKLTQLQMRYAGKEEITPRLARYLAQRGFPATIVQDTLRQLLNDAI